MARYDIGDVVLVMHSWENPDGSITSKPRPAIVYQFSSDNERLLIKITHVNRSSEYKGLWIEKSSKGGQEMGLLMDSFVHCEETFEVSFRDIRRRIGSAALIMDEIDDIMEDLEPVS